jgi:transposase
MTEKRRKVTKEFKETAVQLSFQEGNTIQKVSKDLGIPYNLLQRWRTEMKENPKYCFPGNGKLKEPENELRRLQKELNEVKLEREILKKAVAIFSRRPE